MDKDTRNAIERATQKARRLLQDDLAAQLEGHFDVLLSGVVAAKAGPHLSAREQLQREKIVAAIEHKRAAGMKPDEAVADYIRDAAFTTLNRFVALKMLEARELVQECISRGEQSGGYKEFCGLAPGLALLPDAAGYRLYVESLFDELSVEIKVLFDRRDAASVLWPRRQTFDDLLVILNAQELSGVWAEDETIGWVYQYFNSGDERRAMRDASQAPRNSRELAVRNQFFTPRYVVQFLTDNTLGRTWYEMRKGDTVLRDRCEYLVRRPSEVFLAEGAKVPLEEPTEGLSQEELLRRTVHVPHRPKKDPRDLKILDPACGSGHFLLYAFDLLLAIYDEAWADPDQPKSEATGRTLATDFPDRQALLRGAPVLVVQHNLHGVDIDPRCAQISQLALWMRAQRAFRNLSLSRAERPRIRRSNVVLAEPMPGEADILSDFTSSLGDPMLGELFTKLVDTMKLAGELGLLLRLEQIVRMPGKGQLELLAPPEERIHSTLLQFLNAAGTDQRTRRRLFADDADHGLALLELAGKRFDVVLMNPPFGLVSKRATGTLRTEYPEDWTDLYATFLVRGTDFLCLGGRIGAITSSLWLATKRQETLRRHLSQRNRLVHIAKLGNGVLDGATVSTALVIAQKTTLGHVVGYVDVSDQEDENKAAALRTTRSREFRIASFDGIPTSPLAFDLGDTRIRLWECLERLDPALGTVFKGNTTFDNSRFLRTWWEVSPLSIGQSWVRYDKGGHFQLFFNPSVLVWNHRDGARENAAFGEMMHGSPAQVLQSSKHWFKAGLCYSRASSVGFSPRVLPPEHVPNEKSISIILRNAEQQMSLLALLASTAVQDLLLAFGDHRNIEKGSVASLPLGPNALDGQTKPLSELGERGVRLTCRLESTLEISPVFARPAKTGERAGIISEIVDVCRRIDSLAAAVLFKGNDAGSVLSTPRPNVVERSLLERFPDVESYRGSDWLSFFVGVAFDRWSAGDVGKELTSWTASVDYTISPGPSACEMNSSGIRVSDPGHRFDLAAGVATLLTSAPDSSWTEAELRRQIDQDFFSEHVARYSQSGRAAPLYWQLATSSASYSVWLYLHAFSADTFYKVQNDYVAPKLGHEERKLDGLRREYGDNPTTSQRKELDSQESFVAELRTFLDEVKRVAPLWKPDLDDGVIINFAPLWRLVPHHRPWQKECKTTWDALADGDYDWSHLAMHLWPERVVPKCTKDRSLAIAHGLEEIFWAEGSDGKSKPRATPTRPLNDLIKERTSSAVKAALDSLLSAPQPGGTSRPRGKGKRAATGGES